MTVHRGGGLSQRHRAQGGQLPGAVPCRPFARRFVRTMKAVVSKRCSKSRHCVQGTSLKTILERSGKHTGLGSWADIRGLARQSMVIRDALPADGRWRQHRARSPGACPRPATFPALPPPRCTPPSLGVQRGAGRPPWGTPRRPRAGVCARGWFVAGLLSNDGALPTALGLPAPSRQIWAPGAQIQLWDQEGAARCLSAGCSPTLGPLSFGPQRGGGYTLSFGRWWGP